MTSDDARRAQAARLRTERERHGWGVRRMARFLRDAVDDHQKPDVPSFVTYVKRWESGDVDITDARYRAAYARVLDIPESSLFGLAPTVEMPTFPEALDMVLNATGTLTESAPDEVAKKTCKPPQDSHKTQMGTIVDVGDLGEDEWDGMERRKLLQLAALGIGTGVLANTSDQSLRRLVDVSLTAEPRSLEDWEITCADHLYAIRTQPAHRVREDMLLDLLSIRHQIKKSKQCDVVDLHRLQAALATLHANILTRLGEHGSAIRWWRTARHSADVCGDLNLRLLVRGSEAGFGLYGQRAPETILHLTRNARQIAGKNSSVGLAIVVSAEAKALSLLGRHEEAKRALLTLESFTPGQSASSPIPNYWTGDQIHFTESWVYAGAGEESEAENARRLVLSETGDYQYTANTQIHQAISVVVSGGINDGVMQAAEVLDNLPKSHRSQMITEMGNVVLQSVPFNRRADATVAEYREVLANTAPETSSLGSAI